MLLRILSGSHYLGLSLLLLSWILSVVLQVSRGSVPRVLRVSLLAVFRSLVAFLLLPLHVLAVYSQISSICPVYTSSMTYASTVCAPCRQILRPIVRPKTLPDSPTNRSWSKLLSQGTTRALQAMAVWYALRGIVFRYCRYILACALGVRYCSHSQYSQYLGLLSTRNILAAVLQYSQYSGYDLFSSIYLWNLYVLPSAPRNIDFGGIYIVFAVS